MSRRRWILDGYNFYQFPPPTKHKKGTRKVTFEGLRQDARVLLYAMLKIGTQNWRSVSPLVAENFMGELAEYARSNNGVPNGAMLNNDTGKMSQLHGMRMNPNR